VAWPSTKPIDLSAQVAGTGHLAADGVAVKNESVSPKGTLENLFRATKGLPSTFRELSQLAETPPCGLQLGQFGTDGGRLRLPSDVPDDLSPLSSEPQLIVLPAFSSLDLHGPLRPQGLKVLIGQSQLRKAAPGFRLHLPYRVCSILPSGCCDFHRDLDP
jgi:hypothetical protein